MGEDRDERIWPARLRWRLRGAWTAPVFAALTLGEAVLLHRLPIAGDQGPDVLGAFLLCGFFNLALVGFAAPVLARLRRRGGAGAVPLPVVQDRIATAAMAALALLLGAIGALHHSEVQASRAAYAENLRAVRSYVLRQAPPQYHAGLAAIDVWKQKDDVYRSCVPGPDPKRSLCLYVETDGITTVTPDHDQQSNAKIAGSENPGRHDG